MRFPAGLLALCLLVVGPAPADTLDDPLPFDPAVSKGTLDNGMTWLIRENGKPEARADLRLVVKAGSVDEDEDQRGLAHFVEHMLFNGTESWEGTEIVDYLESIGARFGADLNAYTSFDETVYMQHIPTDKEGLLRQGLEILGEFAWKATLSDEEIERERGVVLDEWRGGLGASRRVRDEQLAVVLKGSRYAERLPIGLPEIIREGDPEALRRYYRDWYRPERMAIVAVGDFDAAEVEAWIREIFGAIPPTPELRDRIDFDVPADPDTLFALADDPELRGTSVGWSTKGPWRGEAETRGEYRQSLVESMALSMFNQRLAEVARSENPPFLRAGGGRQRFGRMVELTDFSARVQDGGEARGLAALLEEVRRTELHGFLGSELDRARRSMIAGIEATWAEREKTGSGAYVGEYMRHFLHGEPVPGIDVEVDLWRELLPGVTVEECHRTFLELARGEGVVVEVTRPTQEEPVGEEEFLAVLRVGADAAPEPYVDGLADVKLLATTLPAGRVVARTEIPKVGATQLTLSNGIEVFVKTTDFQDDEVRFLGQSLGGTSVVDDEDLPSAAFAATIVAESGWGGHSVVDLRKMLAGKVVSVRPYFDDRRHGVSGSSTVADLPTALDLCVLGMTAPNRDPAAFERVRERLHASLVNRAKDPGARYSDRRIAVNTMDDPRARPMTLERIDEIDHEQAVRFYEASFANASDFSFFFVGNVDADELAPLLERTLGSLPAGPGPPARFVEREIPFPDGEVRETVRAGSEPKARTDLTFPSYDGTDPREWHRLRTAASVLGRRLRERMREDLGATYGVGVSYQHQVIGPAGGKFTVGFGSDPADREALAAEVFAAVEELRRDGPTADEITTEQELQYRDLETALEQNGFWMGSLAALWVRERPLEEVRNRRLRIDELTPESIHRVLREHLSPDHHTWLDWIPESGDDPATTAGS
jgi:zinc protease